jgi:site-specific DNA recombinase
MIGKELQNKSKRCAFVIRVSTEEQARNKEGSLTTQLQRLRAHVEYKSGACGEDWRETDQYVLRGVSGKDSVRSPEFERLFADIESNKVNTVLCTALDRVSRSVKDFLHFFEFLNLNNVEFVCLRENYDTTSPQGKFLITVMMALAEFEREQTSERTKDAVLARAERGLWNGGQLLGYDPDPDRKGNLLPNERERVIVNCGFDTYLECGSILETARRLNERGFRTKEYRSRRDKFHPAARFRHASVQHMLTNYAYTGKKEINKKKRTQDQSELPESQRYRIVDAVWEPIVDADKFERVQKLLKQNQATKHNGVKRIRHSYLLNAGLLACGECGSQMEGRCGTGSKKVKYYYYLCKNRDCRLKVPAGEIEGVVTERIRQLAHTPKLLDEIVNAANEKLQMELPARTKQKDLLQKDLAEVNAAAEALVGQLEILADNNGASFVHDRLEQLAKRRVEIDSSLEELDQSILDVEREAVDQNQVVKALSSFGEVFDVIPPYQQKELIRLVLQKAFVSHEQLELAL